MLVIAAARVDRGNNAAEYNDGTGDRQTDGDGGTRGPLLAPGQSTRRVSDAFVRFLGRTGSRRGRGCVSGCGVGLGGGRR